MDPAIQFDLDGVHFVKTVSKGKQGATKTKKGSIDLSKSTASADNKTDKSASTPETTHDAQEEEGEDD